MANLTFNDLIKQVDEDYDHLTIEFDDKKLVLLNVMRLSDQKREAISKLYKDENEDLTLREFFEEIIRNAARNADVAEEFLTKVNQKSDSLAYLSVVVEQYGEKTQVGEA